MEKKRTIVGDILLALVIGVAAGVAVMAVGGLLGAIRGGLAGGLLWGRALTLVAGGVAMVYGGLLLFRDDGERGSAAFFQWSPGKKNRTLIDELQPREDAKKIFHVLPRKHSALCIAVGLLCSSLIAELLIAVLL